MTLGKSSGKVCKKKSREDALGEGGGSTHCSKLGRMEMSLFPRALDDCNGSTREESKLELALYICPALTKLLDRTKNRRVMKVRYLPSTHVVIEEFCCPRVGIKSVECTLGRAAKSSKSDKVAGSAAR